MRSRTRKQDCRAVLTQQPKDLPDSADEFKKETRRCAMELGRVTGIRLVIPVKASGSTVDVVPAIAIESPDRMGDDSYNANTNEQDRGMEDEDTGEPSEKLDETNVSEDVVRTPENQVDLFA